MATKVRKWGNSLAVRLPKGAVMRFGLKEGSEVAVEESAAGIVVRRIPIRAKHIRKEHWARFLVPSAQGRKKEKVSATVDKILYGKSAR